MKAFLSAPESGINWWRQGHGSIPQWDLQSQAQREASKILAESERNEADQYGRATYHVTTCAVPSAVLPAYEGRYMGPVMDPCGAMMAESLASILPELDRLADMSDPGHTHRLDSQCDDMCDIWFRNLATLRQMGA